MCRQQIIDRGGLISAVNKIIQGDKLELLLYVILSDNGLRLLDMDNNDLKNMISDYVNDVNAKICQPEYVLKNYSTADERKRCYFRFDLNEEPDIFKLIREAGTEVIPTLFTTKDNKLSDIVGMISIVSYDGKVLKLYKHIYPLEKMAVQDRRLFLIKDDKRFVKATDDMLNINPTFSVLYVDQTFILIDIDKLEKTLGLTTTIINEATQLIEKLKATDLIADITDITKHIGSDLGLTKRFVATIRNSPVINKGIQKEKVIAFAKSKVAKVGKIPIDENALQFAPKYKSEVNRIIKILNDDYLRSELTDEEYDSVVKDTLKDNQG